MQRKLARQQKFGRNWLKTKARIARLQQHMARMRKDFLHKITTRWAKEHPIIILEDLRIGNMTRSTHGTIKEPGKNVAAKSGLNRSILDQGWGMCHGMLAYKMPVHGGYPLLVPAQRSSQECSRCGHVSADNRKTRDLFQCEDCGHTEHADVNAAKVILARGLKQTA